MRGPDGGPASARGGGSPGATPEALKERNTSPPLTLAQRFGLRVQDAPAVFTDTAPERRALPGSAGTRSRAVRGQRPPLGPGTGRLGGSVCPTRRLRRPRFPFASAPSALVLEANLHASECRLDFRPAPREPCSRPAGQSVVRAPRATPPTGSSPLASAPRPVSGHLRVCRLVAFVCEGRRPGGRCGPPGPGRWTREDRPGQWR